MAATGAWNRANMDLVVARVEDDILEINAPEDLALEARPAGDAADEDDAVAAVVDGNDQNASDIDISETDSIFTDDGESTDSTISHISTDPSTDNDDDDRDSIDSGEHSPNTAVKKPIDAPKVSKGDEEVVTGDHCDALPPASVATGLTRTVVNAIVDDDQSAEADANAEIEPIENRLNESIPWEEYEVPQQVDDGDEGETTLRPSERAQLLFETNLMGRLQTFEETGVVEPMLVQMLTHG